jgi:hypothetical protein
MNLEKPPCPGGQVSAWGGTIVLGELLAVPLLPHPPPLELHRQEPRLAVTLLARLA